MCRPKVRRPRAGFFFAPTLLVTGRPAREFDGAILGGHRVVGRILAADGQRVVAALLATWAKPGPAPALCLGVAADGTALAFERTAVNVLSALANKRGQRRP